MEEWRGGVCLLHCGCAVPLTSCVANGKDVWWLRPEQLPFIPPHIFHPVDVKVPVRVHSHKNGALQQ